MERKALNHFYHFHLLTSRIYIILSHQHQPVLCHYPVLLLPQGREQRAVTAYAVDFPMRCLPCPKRFGRNVEKTKTIWSDSMTADLALVAIALQCSLLISHLSVGWIYFSSSPYGFFLVLLSLLTFTQKLSSLPNDKLPLVLNNK